MTNLNALLAAAIAAGIALPATAQGLRHCGERDAIVQSLAEGYGESRQSVGLGANNSLVEVFASTETGTWTITVTTPNGLMCLLASGQAYEPLSEDLAAILDQDA
jgi:hypothetical protein